MRSALGNVMGLGGLAAVTDTADLAADAAATDGTGSGELSEAQMNQLKRRLLVLGGGLGAVGALLALYHGYQRSGASLAMLGWGALGFFLPVVTIPVMLVQGYGEV
jgi:drug/metabolite transporter (DMT)-like permease